MVYFYTSKNIKLMKDILKDYEVRTDISAYEYMKVFIEKCPEATADVKIAWQVETFLGIHKHYNFLKVLTTNLAKDLSDDEELYFIIILYGITFELDPKDTDHLYKSVFNLSKKLLDVFTKFFSNNEILTFVSQVASPLYDCEYITNNILEPLFGWQPYISEMAHSYEEYEKKMERRKVRKPTVPVQMNILNRKNKSILPAITSPVHIIPNAEQGQRKRMLSKTTIDQNLQNLHEKNKNKANNLLNLVKKNAQHYTQGKSENYHRRMSNIRNEIENDMKPLPKPRHKFALKAPSLPVKETATSIKRMNKRMQLEEQEEVCWLEKLIENCSNTTKFDQIQEKDRQRKERDRLVEIEKKHLMGQISHEEAIIARAKLLEDNKKKHEDFLKEKQVWCEAIELWKETQREKNKKQAEKLSLLELNLLEAKTNANLKRKELADQVRSELDTLRAKALKEKNDELENKINLIKQIKILSEVAKKAKLPKILDLTETSGFGLLCEMSMAELQERLSSYKMQLHEELEKKKNTIKEENATAKLDLEQTKITIDNYKTERAMLKTQNKKHEANTLLSTDASPVKEINDLKKILEQKRKLRLKMTN